MLDSEVPSAYTVEPQDDGRALLVISGGFAIRYASEESANKAREALIASTLRQRAEDRAKEFIA